MISKRLMAAVFALSALAALSAAACSNAGRSADPTPVQTFKITPSAGGAATKPPSAPTAAATATGAATAAATSAATSAASPAATTGATPAATSGGGTKLTVVGLNSLFDKTTLTAPAGKISIEFDNQDVGVPHNFHVFKGADVTGEDMGATPIDVGPKKDTLDVTLDKGEYYYQCDVHPTTMAGKLTVN